MLDRANDLITYRIDSVLNEISTMSLCDLPEDEPITPDEFLHNTEVNFEKKTENLLFYLIIDFM